MAHTVAGWLLPEVNGWLMHSYYNGRPNPTPSNNQIIHAPAEPRKTDQVTLRARSESGQQSNIGQTSSVPKIHTGQKIARAVVDIRIDRVNEPPKAATDNHSAIASSAPLDLTTLGSRAERMAQVSQPTLN
jgi:hypothetical protein